MLRLAGYVYALGFVLCWLVSSHLSLTMLFRHGWFCLDGSSDGDQVGGVMPLETDT